MATAKKNDKLDNKAPLEFLRLDGVQEMCRVFEYGAKKYGKNNYLLGHQDSQLTAAALRHILAYQSGEHVDPETGYPHLAHAQCCLAMFFTQRALGTLRLEND